MVWNDERILNDIDVQLNAANVFVENTVKLQQELFESRDKVLEAQQSVNSLGGKFFGSGTDFNVTKVLGPAKQSTKFENGLLKDIDHKLSNVISFFEKATDARQQLSNIKTKIEQMHAALDDINRCARRLIDIASELFSNDESYDDRSLLEQISIEASQSESIMQLEQPVDNDSMNLLHQTVLTVADIAINDADQSLETEETAVFQCDYCKNNFLTRNLLKRHIFVHVRKILRPIRSSRVSLSSTPKPTANIDLRVAEISSVSTIAEEVGDVMEQDEYEQTLVEEPISLSTVTLTNTTIPNQDISSMPSFRRDNGKADDISETNVFDQTTVEIPILTTNESEPSGERPRMENEINLVQHCSTKSNVTRKSKDDGQKSATATSSEKSKEVVSVVKPKATKIKRRFECFLCKFRSKRCCAMKRHMIRHTGAKPSKCGGCGTRFSVKTSLNNQTMKDLAKRPFQCMVCKKRFIHRGNLNQHMLIHTKEKPFSCNECTKSFSQKITRDRHLLTHRKIKTFKCKNCETAFQDKSTLFGHIFSVHKPNRLYECYLCGYWSNQLYHVKMHMPTHTGKKPFKCEKCASGFTHKYTLLRHQKTSKCMRPRV